MAATTTAPESQTTMQLNIQEARSSLKTAISQLGLVLRFHRDVKALGVESYAAKAPGSITRPLAQAIKDYNDACDAMEAELMKARQVILHDMTKSNTPADIKAEQKDGNGKAGYVADASSASLQEQDPTNDPSELQKLAKKPKMLEDDEMEDLFGSGNSTSISSPVNATSQAAAPTAPMSSMLPEPSGTFPQNALKLEEGSSGIGGNSQLEMASLGLNLGDLPDAGSRSMDADFSSMSANDFNSLLASLGAGGGQAQEGTGNLMGDFSTGNIDFSAFGSLFDSTGGAS